MIEPRSINEGVVIFLKHEGKYLLLKRSMNQEIDPGVYNGVGGRVHKGESYLETAIRKVKEEAGLDLDENRLRFVGLAREEECEFGDWTIAFFVADVESEKLPIDLENDQGILEWVAQDEVLDKNVVADLKILWKEITNESGVFFADWKRKNDKSPIVDLKVQRSA